MKLVRGNTTGLLILCRECGKEIRADHDYWQYAHEAEHANCEDPDGSKLRDFKPLKERK